MTTPDELVWHFRGTRKFPRLKLDFRIHHLRRSPLRRALWAVLLTIGFLPVAAGAQAAQSPAPGQGSTPVPIVNTGQGPAGKDGASGRSAQQGGSSRSATGAESKVDSTARAEPPPGPEGRPRIGLALAGGGALAMSEIGVLQWLEEHHIPVDMIAGTSMGALLGALYATGRTPEQMKKVMSTDAFNAVFRLDTAYTNRGFRRREDSRELPNGGDGWAAPRDFAAQLGADRPGGWTRSWIASFTATTTGRSSTRFRFRIAALRPT